METFKNLFKNKIFRMVAIAALVLFVIWLAYTSYNRSKKRTNWINWINSAPSNDEWKAKLIEEAKEKGISLEAQIATTAAYLFPANPFKSAKG